MAAHPVLAPSDHSWPSLKRIEGLWAEAGVEPRYLEAMRAALVLEHADACVCASCPARNTLPLRLLPGLCCKAAGGEPQRAEIMTAAWGLLCEAAHLLDSIEDGEAEAGLSSKFSPGQILNIAVGLITSASLALCAMGDTEATRAIRSDFYRTGLKMCAGQHDDLTRCEPTLEQCWQIAGAKSGEFFALACRAGARLAETTHLDLFGEFGHHLGILIQIADDLSGLWPTVGERSDLATGKKWTLPVAYAMTVLPAPKHDELSQCLKTAPTVADAEEGARRLIVESGAVLYLTIEAEKHRRQGQVALEAAASPSAAREALLAMLNEIASLGQA